MMPLMRAAAAFALLLAFGVAAEDAPIPPLTGRVVDLNGTLTVERSANWKRAWKDSRSARAARSRY